MSHDDSLRRQIRSLKLENRHLRKLVKKFAKGKHRLEILEEIAEESTFDEEEAYAGVKETDSCPSCKTGKLNRTDIGNIRTIEECDSCDHRKVIKNG